MGCCVCSNSIPYHTAAIAVYGSPSRAAASAQEIAAGISNANGSLARATYLALET